MIYAINFSDSKFEEQRNYNSLTAIKRGKVDKVIEYSPKDIDVDFCNKHSTILNYKRGAGLWLWKPYFILKALKEMSDGDYLFYCDSGAFYVNKVKHLINALEKTNQTVMGFELPLLERQFTKKESFIAMGARDSGQRQILATYILFKKDRNSIDFVQEWLNYCCQEEIISPNTFDPNIHEFDDFLVHREDQSILSILYHKYGYTPFREASQYGDRPFEHLWIPAYSWSKPWKYLPRKHSNSRYPKIVVSCRTKDPIQFEKIEFVKSLLFRLGLYNEVVYSKLKGINRNSDD
ncbi:MAG: hypothetical protein N4A74_20360 [Carboxylicivirga sp.]|jgi:hypothetical protein|nr:hypothetical protein [Carboxylicivirga sp.]